jgi:ribonuclease HI
MDDATWFTSNREDTQKIQNITDSFAKLANLKNNPDKASLITINNNETGTIQAEGYTIKKVGKNEPIRILGTWVTETGSKLAQKRIIKEKTEFTTAILKRKRITDKQCRYILNHVLMPSIEYLLQDTILSKTECDKINSRITNIFKYKIGIARTGINSGIHLFTSYKIFHIEDRQLQLQLRTWYRNLNKNNLCGTITRGRLQHLQNKCWTTKNILEDINDTGDKNNKNLTGKILDILKANNITIKECDQPLLHTLKNDRLTPIERYVTKTWYNKNRANMRKHNIAFIEQLTNAGQTHTLNWTQVKANEGCKYICKCPKWYTELRNYISTVDVQDNTWKIIIDNLPQNSLIRRKAIIEQPIKRGQYIATKIDQNIYMGKKTAKSKIGQTLAVVEHYTQIAGDSPIQKCNGCDFNQKLRKTGCTRKIPLDDSIPITVKKTSHSSKIYNYLEGQLTRTQQSPNTIRHSIESKMIQQPTQMVTVSIPHPGEYNQRNTNLTTSEEISKTLQDIKNKTQGWENIDIYTDGSLETYIHNNKRMGIGIVMLNQETGEKITTNGRCENFPSSTKAELIAIATALEIAPKKANVNIYTDSKCAIQAITTIENNQNKLTKKANYITSTLIKETIEKREGVTRINKVKAHAGNILNKEADKEANKGREKTLRHNITVNAGNLTSLKATIKWKEYDLDTNINEFGKTICNAKWLSKWATQNRNLKITDNNTETEIDWTAT